MNASSGFSSTKTSHVPSNMASRARQSTAQPTPRTARASTVQATPARSTEAPPHEPPNFALNPSAQRLLANLKRSHDLQKLEKSLVNAQGTLSEAAADLNFRLSGKRKKLGDHKERVQKRREQNASLEDDVEMVERLQERHDRMHARVENMTQRMEETIRKLLDGQEYLGITTQALDATLEDARNNASTQASTQNARTQRLLRSRRGGGEEGEEGEEGEDTEIPDFHPTDPTTGTQASRAPIDVFKEAVENARTRYQAGSNYERYAHNPKYANYRRMVHDAAYPEGARLMPRKEDWFYDDGTVAPVGYTKRPNDGGEDSDDDIAVSRATVSIKCPLTLVEFVDPLTSTKCDHSFESSVILRMLRISDQRLPAQPGQTRGVQAVRCPVSACTEMLSRNDLQRDEGLILRIRRQQKAMQARDEDDEDEGDDEDSSNLGATQRGAHRIDSDDDDIVDDNHGTPTRLKTEIPARVKSIPLISQSPPNVSQPSHASIAVDISDEEVDAGDEMSE